MAIMPPLLPMMAGGESVSVDSGPAIGVREPTVWLQLYQDRFTGHYSCDPIYKAPNEDLDVGVNLLGIANGNAVTAVTLAYAHGHGVTFNATALVLGGSIAAMFALSGGRRNTRHVLAVSVTTADDTHVFYCPVVVVR